MDQGGKDHTHQDQQQWEIDHTEDSLEHGFHQGISESLLTAHDIQAYKNQTQAAAQKACDLDLLLFEEAHHDTGEGEQVHQHIEIIVL